MSQNNIANVVQDSGLVQKTSKLLYTAKTRIKWQPSSLGGLKDIKNTASLRKSTMKVISQLSDNIRSLAPHAITDEFKLFLFEPPLQTNLRAWDVNPN